MLLKTKIKIEKWLNKYNIVDYELIEDKNYGYVVNVNYDVHLSNLDLKDIEVKFNIIKGWFYCNSNKLKSLKGCPEIVDGGFDCSHNELESLIGCPKIINGNFNISKNNIKQEEIMYLLEIEAISQYIYIEDNYYNLPKITTLNDIKKRLKVIKEKESIDKSIENLDLFIKSEFYLSNKLIKKI